MFRNGRKVRKFDQTLTHEGYPVSTKFLRRLEKVKQLCRRYAVKSRPYIKIYIFLCVILFYSSIVPLFHNLQNELMPCASKDTGIPKHPFTCRGSVYVNIGIPVLSLSGVCVCLSGDWWMHSPGYCHIVHTHVSRTRQGNPPIPGQLCDDQVTVIRCHLIKGLTHVTWAGLVAGMSGLIICYYRVTRCYVMVSVAHLADVPYLKLKGSLK